MEEELIKKEIESLDYMIKINVKKEKKISDLKKEIIDCESIKSVKKNSYFVFSSIFSTLLFLFLSYDFNVTFELITKPTENENIDYSSIYNIGIINLFIFFIFFIIMCLKRESEFLKTLTKHDITGHFSDLYDKELVSLFFFLLINFIMSMIIISNSYMFFYYFYTLLLSTIIFFLYYKLKNNNKIINYSIESKIKNIEECTEYKKINKLNFEVLLKKILSEKEYISFILKEYKDNSDDSSSIILFLLDKLEIKKDKELRKREESKKIKNLEEFYCVEKIKSKIINY